MEIDRNPDLNSISVSDLVLFVSIRFVYDESISNKSCACLIE